MQVVCKHSQKAPTALIFQKFPRLGAFVSIPSVVSIKEKAAALIPPDGHLAASSHSIAMVIDSGMCQTDWQTACICPPPLAVCDVRVLSHCSGVSMPGNLQLHDKQKLFG